MTVVLTASIILFGVLGYLSLPVNDLPSVDYPVIQVSVGYPGATPETMANNVATPLEREFMQIPGLELVTSSSGQGSTSFVLQFALSKSIDAAATDVQAAISRAEAELPVDLPAPPTFTKTNPNDQPLIYIGLGSDSVTEGQLWDYASTQVGERISILPGVSQIGVYGAQSAVRIKADPSAMAARNLTLDDLVGAVRGGTSYTGAGQFDGAHRTFLLETQGQLTDASQYNQLIVGQVNGAPIYLKDVATLRTAWWTSASTCIFGRAGSACLRPPWSSRCTAGRAPMQWKSRKRSARFCPVFRRSCPARSRSCRSTTVR